MESNYKKLKPKISIIVPVYNVEKYLDRCINSLVRQTFKSYEILLIDDGSTDNSGDICDQFSEKYSNIRVFHLKNGGVSRARNFGIEKALGDYIMFCDSDDYVDKQWCEILYNYIILYPNSWIGTGLYNINHYDKFKKMILYDYEKKFNRIKKDKYYQIMQSGLSGFLVIRIYERKKIINNKLKFKDSLTYGEDVIFNCEYLNISDDIVMINKPLYYYVKYDNTTLSSQYYPNKFTLIKNIYSARKKFISEEYKNQFYNEYMYYFILALKDTFNKKNKSNILNKLKYNHNAINSYEFIECLQNSNKTGESKLYIRLLETKNYYIVYLVELIITIKNLIYKKIRM